MSSGFRATTLWRLFAAGSSVLTALITFHLYDQYLGRAGLFGLIQTAVTVVALLPQFDGGFRLAINRRLLLGRNPIDRRNLVDFAQVFYSWMALFAGLLGMLVLTGYSWNQNARNAGVPWSFYLTLGSLGGWVVLNTAQSQLLVGLGRQRQLFILNVIAAWLNLGILWLAFRQGQTAWAFPLAQGFSLAVPTLIAWWLARLDLPGLRLLTFVLPPGFWPRFQGLRSEAAPAFARSFAPALHAERPAFQTPSALRAPSPLRAEGRARRVPLPRRQSRRRAVNNSLTGGLRALIIGDVGIVDVDRHPLHAHVSAPTRLA